MFHVVYRTNSDIKCSGDDLDPSNADFCSKYSINSYLRTYTILIGDFNLEHYKDSTTVMFLWFLLTLFGVVIMLNVLIAVVSESYIRSQQSSAVIFRT